MDLSPNVSPKNRSKSNIKFVIIHYTGMQSEIESIKRLKNPKSKVSCHFLINKKGVVTQIAKVNKTAWHAGKSKWKKYVNLNSSSIGIELENKGHEKGYESVSYLQIKSLINLSISIKKKYKIKRENFLGHSDISPLRKIDPGEKFPWQKLSKFNLGYWYTSNLKKFFFEKNKNHRKMFFRNLFKIGYRYFQINKKNIKNDRLVIKAFQQRYNPSKVTGKIDKKTLQISHFLANL